MRDVIFICGLGLSLLFSPLFVAYVINKDSVKLVALAMAKCSKIGGEKIKQREVNLFDCYKDDQLIDSFGRFELIKNNDNLVKISI